MCSPQGGASIRATCRASCAHTDIAPCIVFGSSRSSEPLGSRRKAFASGDAGHVRLKPCEVHRRGDLATQCVGNLRSIPWRLPAAQETRAFQLVGIGTLSHPLIFSAGILGVRPTPGAWKGAGNPREALPSQGCRKVTPTTGSGAPRRWGFARVARAFPGAGRVNALKSREEVRGCFGGQGTFNRSRSRRRRSTAAS